MRREEPLWLRRGIQADNGAAAYAVLDQVLRDCDCRVVDT